VGISVPAIYPIAFWAALLGVTWLGTADARDQRRTRASNQSRGWGTG
jgi:hypothetical protein